MFATKKRMIVRMNEDLRGRLVYERPRAFYPVHRIASKIITDFLQIYNVNNLPDISKKKKDGFLSLTRHSNLRLERSDYENLKSIAKAKKVNKQHLVRAMIENYFENNKRGTNGH